MIRSAAAADKSNIMALLSSLSMFPPNELQEMSGMLDAFFATPESTDSWLVFAEDRAVLGIAYCAPERMTHGTWNLYFIGVRVDRRNSGIGAALIRHVEQDLIHMGARILLVETSGLESYVATQKFYRNYGFEQEARIRDFYKAGEDKIIFRKAIAQ